jgi:hypothetical protein
LNSIDDCDHSKAACKKKFIQKQVIKSFIFRPNDNFKSKWDLMVIFCAVFNCYTIPYKVSFEPPIMNTSFFTVLNLIIDIIFLIDILINFRTSYIDSKGNEVEEPTKIASNYMSG